MLTKGAPISEISGLKYYSAPLETGDSTDVYIKALAPRLKFTILAEDFFLFGGEVAKSLLDRGKPFMRSIFVSDPSIDADSRVYGNADTTQNENGFEIRVEAFPYCYGADIFRKKYNSSAKHANNEKGFVRLLGNIKKLFCDV